MKRRMLISGGTGKFAQKIIEKNNTFIISSPARSEMDVFNYDQVINTIDRYRPDIFLHAAALTRPMAKHDHDPSESIRSNIIGTSNVPLACMTRGVKLVYISTDYVYPGVDGDYTEDSPLLPFNKYGWSKMGGECAVHLYDNSLILRVCMNNKPFPHPKALIDVKKSLIFDDEAAEIVLKLVDETGVINVGGVSRSIYEFAKEHNSRIEKISLKEIRDVVLA